MIHSLLNRQLKKNSLSFDDAPPKDNWQDFLERVSRTYSEADSERYLLERSLKLSSDEMQEMFEQLQKSETRYALASRAANDGMWEWNLQTGEYYYSSRLFEILGIDEVPAVMPTHQFWLDKVHPEDKERVQEDFIDHFKGNRERFHSEHRVKHTDGTYHWILTRGLAVRNKDGRVTRIAGSVSDINERKQVEEKLAYDAVHDILSGLPNRKSFMDRLSQAIGRIKSDEDFGFAVLFIDLDRFKTINDSLGHHHGDEYLIETSHRLNRSVRPNDMVARLGGDEFVILADNIKDEEQVTGIAQRILDLLQRPVSLAGQQICTSASIGIVFSSSDYEEPEDLVRDADLAMYRAKLKGKARYEVFDPQMHKGALSLFQMEMDLRQAIENKEFSVFYQPIVSLDTDSMVGFEALLRWKHPTQGMIAPSDFIPIAEETGLIIPIGKWVLQEACRQMKSWHERYPASEKLIVSVNLSARQLEQKHIVEEVFETLAITGLNPSCLKLEITESVIMNNAEQAEEKVRILRDLGVRVSIDDFGTGYSSLSYLHRFPIDTLKADRSFIARIGQGDENSEIIRTIISLARNLGIEVIAEGIETPEQLDFLREMDCGYGQGYYYSKPINGLAATEMVESIVETPEFAIPASYTMTMENSLFS